MPLTLFAGGLISWQISRSITAPLARIRSTMDVLSRGEAATVADTDRADEIGIGLVELPRRFASTNLDIAAHAGGEVDDHCLVLRADAVDDLGIELDIAGTLAGLGIADMAMNHGRARIFSVPCSRNPP